jgi:hypothetical protein
MAAFNANALVRALSRLTHGRTLGSPLPEAWLKNRLSISLISAFRTILRVRWIRSRSPDATSAVALSSVRRG